MPMLFAQDVPLNPLMPDASLSIWNALVVVPVGALAIILIYAGLTLWRSRDRMETTHVLIWTAVIIFAPFVGSIVWLLLGRQLHGVDGRRAPQSAPRLQAQKKLIP